MNERHWELYRLSVVETWSESPYKRAVSAAIEHKLMVLGGAQPRAKEPRKALRACAQIAALEARKILMTTPQSMPGAVNSRTRHAVP